MPVARLEDIDVYYETAGAGPRLLYIGGTGADLRRSPNVFDSPLTASFEVLSFDQRGMGRSGKPDVPYTMAGYARDALALLDHVGWSSCMLMGYSFGGMVAQEVALAAPHRFSRLVLSATSSGGAGGASFPLHTLQGLDVTERAKMMIRLADRRRDQAWADAYRQMYDVLVAQTEAILTFSQDQPGFEIGARRQLEARKDHDTYDRLPLLPMPTLVVGGTHDDLAPESVVRALAARIPGAQVRFFNGGHLFHLQDRASWDVVIAFLNQEAL